MKLRPSTSTENLERRLGAPDTGALRASRRREQYLEKVARMISKADVTVRLHQGGAKCVSPKHDSDLEAIIFIPTQKTEQPKTDLPPDAWDLLFQETELFHELGHVLYTSWEAFEEVKYDVSNRYQKLFKGLVNAIEDGAIETQLANQYNVGDDLTVKNANLAALADATSAENVHDNFDVEGTREYTLRDAVQRGLLDMGYYDSGTFAEILDEDCDVRRLKNEERTRELLEEMIPYMEAVMSDCLSEPDGEQRMYRMLEFWENVKPYFEQSADEDQQEQTEDERPDDTENIVMNGADDADDLPDEDEAEMHVTIVMQSADDSDEDEEQDADQDQQSGGAGGGDEEDDDEASGEDDEEGDMQVGGGAGEQDEESDEEEDAGEAGTDGAQPEQEDDDADHEDDEDAAGDAGAGGDSDEQDDDADADGAEHGEGDDDEEGDEEGDGDGGDSEQGEDEEDGDDDSPAGDVGDDELEQIAEEVEQKYAQEAESERKGDDDGDAGDLGQEDAKQYLEILSSGDNDLSQMEVVEPEQYEDQYDDGRWEESKRKGRNLSSVFEAMLQREREEELLTAQKAGRLDTQSLYKVGVGNGRVFKQRRDPDSKDYSFLIIIDRSGSMDGQDMIAAEDAAGQLVYALDDVGVDVSVLAMHDNIPSLEIPFNADVDRCASRLMTGRTAGTTPLHDMLEVGRERIKRGEGDEPVIIVITDGAPDKKQKYRRQLEKTNCDVWGVYIDNSGRAKQNKKHQQYFDRITYATHEDISRCLREIAQQVMR